MKVTLTLAAAIMTAQGPVRQTVEHTDVETKPEVKDGVVSFKQKDHDLIYNMQHLLSVETDPYGSIDQSAGGLVKP